MNGQFIFDSQVVDPAIVANPVQPEMSSEYWLN